MNLIHLARLYAPHIGGVETHVTAVSRELLKQGHQVTVVTTQDSADEALSETRDGIQVLRIPIHATSKSAIWSWIWQHRALFQTADVVQVHDVFWWLWPIYVLVRNKVFMTFHGWEGQYPVSWKAQLQRLVANTLSRGNVHIGAWIQEFYWDKPDVIIYGGALHTESKPKIPTKLKHVAFLGRLISENEVETYIEIIKILRQTLPDLTVTWVGDGPLAKKAATVGTVTGMTENVDQQLKSADIVFTNSYLSLLEVQAAGKLAVAVYSQRLKQRYLETYPGSQYVVLGSQPTIIATTILDIFSDPKKLTATINSAQIWAKGMTWLKVTQVYEQLWSTKLAS